MCAPVTANVYFAEGRCFPFLGSAWIDPKDARSAAESQTITGSIHLYSLNVPAARYSALRRRAMCPTRKLHHTRTILLLERLQKIAVAGQLWGTADKCVGWINAARTAWAHEVYR